MGGREVASAVRREDGEEGRARRRRTDAERGGKRKDDVEEQAKVERAVRVVLKAARNREEAKVARAADLARLDRRRCCGRRAVLAWKRCRLEPEDGCLLNQGRW